MEFVVMCSVIINESFSLGIILTCLIIFRNYSGTSLPDMIVPWLIIKRFYFTSYQLPASHKIDVRSHRILMWFRGRTGPSVEVESFVVGSKG